MEVASCVLPPSGDRGDDGASAPFRQRRHDVREWQRVDCQTGAYARARFEADRRRWTTNGDDGDSDGHAHARFNHHYGKLVDSLLRTDPRNGLREAASRQLVVFRSQGPVGGSGGGTGGGTVHVVRTRTSLMMASCTSSTTTSWTGPNDANAATAEAPTPPTAPAANDGSLLEDFHNLQLSVNPLDVTAEKSKAVVCRSASRRPPTRQRSHRRRSPQQPTSDAGGGVATPSGPPSHTAIAAANLHRVSRLCHQIHASAVRQAFGTAPAAAANVSLQTRTTSTSTPTPPKREADADAPTANTTVEIVELESSSSDNTNTAPHTNLVRTKSSSNEDIHLPSETSNSMNKSIEDLDDLEQLQTWRRTSKIRRSLQFPKQNRQKSSSTRKPVDIPENSVSVKKIKEDLEKGRRLDTVLRNNSVDLEALDQILQSISGGSSSDKNSVEAEADTEETYKKQKRNSFVTVESIQEVKGRLRRTSSPSSDIYKENGKDEDLDADDGIVVEETCSINGCDCGCDGTEAAHPKTEETSRVKSYVYGMEAALLNKKPAGIRTGSLGSRVKLVNGNFNAKNEDWYNRRKSYGFEQVQTQEDSSNCTLESKKQVESSTDSGICRSSEIVTKTTNNNPYNENHSIVENDQDHKLNGWKEITTGQVKKLASTYDSNGSRVGESGPGQTWSKPLELKSTTITIPIVKNNNVVDLPWYDHGGGGGAEIKRHSIAVDESRYVRRAGQQQQQQQPIQDRRQRRTSLVSPVATVEPFEDEANAAAAIRRIKKVEFCKTEVHFAAESGKVNIVATDEKPPPTQNFRRRRRNSSSGPPADELAGSGGGLPVLRFGDSSEEQNMFGLTADVGAAAAPRICATTSPRLHRRRDVDADARPPALPAPPVAVVVVDAPTDRRNVFGVVTVNADDVGVVVACCQNDATATADATQGNTDEPSENEIKGILKNKPIPPIPYHLGEEASPTASPAAAAAAAAPASPIVTYPSSSSDEETSKWGVKLRHVEKQQPQPPPVLEGPSSIWKSTVTVRNFYEKNGQDGRGKGKEGEVGEGGSAGAATQEFQKRLRSLRPTKKGTPVAADSSCDTKRNCWSVEEGGGGTEHRGYSTKINFGEGEATVVEDDDRRWGRQGNTTWPRLSEELPDKDSKQSPQKGLVVRIGKEDYHALNHTDVRPKITTTGSSDNIPITTTAAATTTKITIDLSKSPLPDRGDHFSAHQRSHFKSTSLILSTIKDKTAKKQQRPLEEAKKSGGSQNHLRAHNKPSSPQKMLAKTLRTEDDDILVNIRNRADSESDLQPADSLERCHTRLKEDTNLRNYLKVPNVNHGLGKIHTKQQYSKTAFSNHEYLKTRAVHVDGQKDEEDCLEYIGKSFEHSHSDSRSSETNTMLIKSENLEERAREKTNEYRIQNGEQVCADTCAAHTNTTVSSPIAHQRSRLHHPGLLDVRSITAKGIRGTVTSSYRRMLDCCRRQPNSDRELAAGCPKMISENTPFSVNDSRVANCDQSVGSAKDNAYRRLEEAVRNSGEHLSRRHDLKTTKTAQEAKTGHVASALWCQHQTANGPRHNDADGEQTTTTPLQVLKRLYEEANVSGGSDADGDAAADKEVQRLMSSSDKMAAPTPAAATGDAQQDECSVVSGSWSKMRAYRILWENRTKFAAGSSTSNTVAKEKDSASLLHRTTNSISNIPSAKVTAAARDEEEPSTPRRGPSPFIQKVGRSSPPPVRPDLTPVEKLSSPSLVGKTGAGTAVDHHKLHPNHIAENIVLRQPKRSEMTYFGIKVSPSPKKKVSQDMIRRETKLLSEKPDLLQHHAKSTSPTRSKYNKPRQKTPEPIYENVQSDKKYKGREFDASGILDELTKAADQILQAVNGYTDEDNKQSTDEEKQKLETIVEAQSWKQTASSKNETKPSNLKFKLKHTSSSSESITKKRTVDGKTTATATAKAMTTTTERQQQGVQQTKKKQDKSDSSTSSKATAAANLKASRRLQRASSREALLHSHGSSSEDLPNRTEVAVRKPRLVKKTKAVQLTMTNGLELKKKPNSIRSSGGSTAARKKEDRATTGKADERILNSLPEIRHKTAVSTIRSTSEKVTKDRPKYKHEDIKKKMPTKKDTTSRGATMAAVTAETATTATVTATATPTCSDSQCNRSAPAPVPVPVHHSSVPPSSTGSKQCSTAPGTPDKAATAKDRHRRRGNDHQHQSSIATASVPTVVTQHRISTANIKKCSSSRSEGVKP